MNATNRIPQHKAAALVVYTWAFAHAASGTFHAINAIGLGLQRCPQPGWLATMECYLSGDSEALDALLFNVVVVVSVSVVAALTLASFFHPHVHR